MIEFEKNILEYVLAEYIASNHKEMVDKLNELIRKVINTLSPFIGGVCVMILI